MSFIESFIKDFILLIMAGIILNMLGFGRIVDAIEGAFRAHSPNTYDDDFEDSYDEAEDNGWTDGHIHIHIHNHINS